MRAETPARYAWYRCTTLRTRALPLLLTAAAVLSAATPAALAAFPQDPPNDPQYATATPDPSVGCLSAQQWELFATIPSCTPLAHDPQGRSGSGASEVWKKYTAGDPSIVVAYVEAGVNWRAPDARDLANQAYLNAGELPPPTTPTDDGVLSVKDYADTPDANGNGYLDPEDLIVRFRDGKDGDHNGYVDDISGWDAYDDQPDPATSDSAYLHSDRQMDRLAGEADNKISRVGTCPRCRLLIVKGGAEALDRTDDIAEAWNFAADAGAKVIVSETADLGYSTLMRRTAEQLDRRGVVMVVSSNDFDSRDHQGGMFHPFAVPANGVVPDLYGTKAGESGTQTFLERSTKTSWGMHNVLSVSSHDGSTSASAPPLGGAVALLMSEGKRLDPPLTGREAVQVLKATAYDVNDSSLSWPNHKGWDEQYGYGRVDLIAAAQAVADGRVPPTVSLDSPDWYALTDPVRDRAPIPVRARIAAPRASGFDWTLDLAYGADPSDTDFKPLAHGSGTRALTGVLARIAPRTLDRTFASATYGLSKTKVLETAERYAVTVRLRATDAAGRTGEDRRSFYARHDASLVPGYPKRIGPGGESQPALVDLNGDARLDIVFGDSDGRIHALDARTRRELPGFPAHTRRNRLVRAHQRVPAGAEPIVANVAVGDLDRTGRPSIVATTTTGRVYAFTARGKLRRGFPVTLDRGVSPAAIPRPDAPLGRAPHRGAFAAPVLGDLDGDGRLDIVQAGWDGYVHALDRRGHELRGWPVKIEVGGDPPSGYMRVRDLKLEGTPCLADLDGDGRLEVVVRAQTTDVTNDDLAPAPYAYVFALHGDGTSVTGWPAQIQGLFEVYGTAQEFITEGTDSPVAADVDGDGNDEVAVSPIFSPTTLLDGDGTQLRSFGAAPGAAASDIPVSFTTSGAFGRFAGGLSFASGGSGAASVAAATTTTGLGLPIHNLERAYDASTGTMRPGFPAEMQGLNFLGAPLVVDVDGDGQAELIEGGDSNALHAYSASGGQAAGFPKWTSGWILWSASAGDVDGDGRTELAVLTREGHLLVWRTKGRAAANTEWWRWHHDEWSTGRYGTDTRPPAALRHVRLRKHRLTWAPGGDDGRIGKARRYRVTPMGGRSRTMASTGLRLPAGARCATVQAIDDAGNLGFPVRACQRSARAPKP